MDLLIKRGLFFLLVGLGLAACNGEVDRSIGTDMIDNPHTLSGKKADKKAEITFEEKVYNTGKITQGEVLNYTYRFTNTGDAPLIISSVIGSCGCTIPRSYPKGKILPGEGGEIEVEFDSDNKWGEQTVSISVTTNTMPALTQLLIKTDIVVPDNMKQN